MAITGISALGNDQILAAASLSSKSAATAEYTSGGGNLQNLYTTVSTNSGNWTGVAYTGDAQGALDEVYTNSANWNSTYNTVTNNSGSWSGRPQEPVSGINIDIFESAGTVVFSGMTGGSTYTGDAQGALNEVYTNSGNWNTVTNKLDTTAFSTVSGNFLTAHQDITASANWDSTYNTVSANSASWTEGIVTLNTATGRYMAGQGSVNTVTGFSSIDGEPVVLGTGTVVGGNNNLIIQLGNNSRIVYPTSQDSDQNYKWSTGNIILMSGAQGYGYYKGHQLWLCRGSAASSHRISFDVNNTAADVVVYQSGHSAVFTPTGFSIWGPTTASTDRRNIDSAVYDSWNSTYNAVSDNSGTWNSATSAVSANSGIWNGKLDASAIQVVASTADATGADIIYIVTGGV